MKEQDVRNTMDTYIVVLLRRGTDKTSHNQFGLMMAMIPALMALESTGRRTLDVSFVVRLNMLRNSHSSSG